MVLDIPIPAVFEPFLEQSRYKGAWGGRGSAKSHTFADLLIERCILKESSRAVCIREYQRSLEQSVKRLLEDKITEHGVGKLFRVLNTHIETPGDGIIIFTGMNTQTEESIKSLEAYDIAWVEEAQTLSKSSLKLLRPTLREPGSEIWLSWNPKLPTDPVDNFLRGNAPRKQGEPEWTMPPDAIVIGSTFRDNPFFPDVLRSEMEYDRSRDPDAYAHVWLGEYERHSESRVFKNWKIEDFETPSDVTFYYGGDWGFSVDPTVAIRCWVRGRNLYIDREVYRIGCEIDHIPALFDSLDGGQMRSWVMTADSARPETISYLNRNGYPRIKAAKKGKDSVKEGVIFLQGYDIIIHPRCIHTIDEFTMYSYVVDKLSGLVTPILEDKKNHVIDSVRYATEALQQEDGWVTF